MGRALRATGRPIVYSCSWPAEISQPFEDSFNESSRPWAAIMDAGCNTFRTFDDIGDSWSSVVFVLDHYGDYSRTLQHVSGPGHWVDMDMLQIGNAKVSSGSNIGLSIDEAKAQLAIWSVMAAPLIMGNDLRTVPESHREILTNPEVISVNQDLGGLSGLRITPRGKQEVWARELHDGSKAVALLNKGSDCGYYDSACRGVPGPCNTSHWQRKRGGYHIDRGVFGRIIDFNGSLESAQTECCSRYDCVAVAFNAVLKTGWLLRLSSTRWRNVSDFDYYIAPRARYVQPVGPTNATSITLNFTEVGLRKNEAVKVRNLFERRDLGTHVGHFSAIVPHHGVAFLKLSTSRAEPIE